MAISTIEARRQLLDDLSEAVDDLGFALASLEAAYERLDERTADRLEETVFRPVQVAYGRAKRTHEQFAQRHGLPAAAFEQQATGRPSTRARGFIEAAVEAAAEADGRLAAIQDAPMLVEVGDVELRSGLAEVRELVGAVPARARELLRVLGR